ncbi:hypothetical protein [Stieleria varia]|nr:hypothetical protein [Stieleria varia]
MPCWFNNFAVAQFQLDIEEAPFHYTETKAENRVTRLMERLESRELKLEYSPQQGYLQSLLKELDIPESSQTLVFSKTSMQVRYISRHNPRAIYFNDDTYVGWVNGSSLAEISTTDPKLGAAFYTVDMMPWRAKIQRADYDCLACHSTSMTQGVPGHTIRSVLTTFDGSIDSQKQSFITSDASPFSQRWGGWYVTGRHGDMKHMGNAYLKAGMLDTSANGNWTHVRDEFDTQNYLSPYSDIVALMVLEHQTQMHNEMTRADFVVRQMLHQQGSAPTDAEEWKVQLASVAKRVVDRMLFCDEAPLTSEVKGSVVFADHFTRRGPSDSSGRSLRDFDLQTRMFRYPLSYLIYSDAFDSLQDCLKQEVCRQLEAVLTGKNQSEEYAHLDATCRADIVQILRETKPDVIRAR